MDELTRRSLLQYACGATAASMVAGPAGAEAQGLAGGLTGGSLSALGTAADSYRVVPEEEGSRRYGMVDDLFHHIRDRSDVKREILYWLTDGRSSFLGATNRFQFVEPIIRPLYRQAGIPLEFGYGLGVRVRTGIAGEPLPQLQRLLRQRQGHLADAVGGPAIRSEGEETISTSSNPLRSSWSTFAIW